MNLCERRTSYAVDETQMPEILSRLEKNNKFAETCHGWGPERIDSVDRLGRESLAGKYYQGTAMFESLNSHTCFLPPMMFTSNRAKLR